MFTKSALLVVLATLVSCSAFAPVTQINNRFGVVAQNKISSLSMSDIQEDVEDFIVNVGDIDDEPADDTDDAAPGWAALNERITELRIKHRRSDKDTGSPEFQVAGITERISYLTDHLKEHPKDFSTRRGLVALVNKRRRLLNYLHSENLDNYRALKASMGIRHKEPSPVLTKDEQYGRFPPQKAKSYNN